MTDSHSPEIEAHVRRTKAEATHIQPDFVNGIPVIPPAPAPEPLDDENEVFKVETKSKRKKI